MKNILNEYKVEIDDEKNVKYDTENFEIAKESFKKAVTRYLGGNLI